MSWFTVKVKYTKQLENGTFKRVSEPYLIAAVSFTDAESRINKELESVIRGEFIVTSITRTDLHDIFCSESSDVWFKISISYDSQDDDSEKTKKVKNVFYLDAVSVEDADKQIKEELKTLMVDYTIDSIIKTKIVEVFPIEE